MNLDIYIDLLKEHCNNLDNEEMDGIAKWLECLNEIATLYTEIRPYGEYPMTKEEYADETMKILDKYKIKVEGAQQ